MNQRHRVFIAINLPEKIKDKLTNYQKKLPKLPIRWTKKENLHITLVFLGYINNEEILNVCEAVKKTASKSSLFSIALNKICGVPFQESGPNEENRYEKPLKMIWAIGRKTKEFISLKNDLEKELFLNNFSSENKEFFPHITLGRVRQMEWRRIEPEERPEIEEDLNLAFEVESIEIMESELKRKGPEYKIIQSVSLEM